MAAIIARSTCLNCGTAVVKEAKDGDPWFHDASGEERCGEDLDDFAVPSVSPRDSPED